MEGDHFDLYCAYRDDYGALPLKNAGCDLALGLLLQCLLINWTV